MADDEDKNGDLDIILDDTADKSAAGDLDISIEKNEPGVEDWKSQFEAAQKRAEIAETARAEAEKLAKQREADAERISRENAEVRGQAVSAEMAAIDNALANVEHERSDAKAKYKLALEAGDFEAAADAQDAIAAVAVKAQRIKEGKAALERRAEDAKSMADPVEKYVAKMSPQSASWVRSHPEVVTDTIKQKQLERAHYRALADDIRVDSAEYFRHMDQEMGYAARTTGDETRQEPQRQQAAPAAPVSRGGAAEAPQTRGTTIRLTAAQREIAALSGLTDAEYAKNLLAIQRERGTTTH
jgi:hypothetical protein